MIMHTLTHQKEGIRSETDSYFLHLLDLKRQFLEPLGASHSHTIPALIFIRSDALYYPFHLQPIFLTHFPFIRYYTYLSSGHLTIYRDHSKRDDPSASAPPRALIRSYLLIPSFHAFYYLTTDIRSLVAYQ